MKQYKSIPVALGFAALATSLLASTTLAQQNNGASPALDILRKINLNPAIAHSLEARNDALMTTGSIVKSNGTNKVLYHLPALEQGMRLNGETASRTWPVRIAQQQLEGSVELRLAYLNAVSVMPEASHIGVEINGVQIGKQPIQSPDRSRTLSFRIPNHILVPGYNAVRIFARHRHRVDCSIDATHELWTDIDAAKTGLVFGHGNSVLNTLDAVAALARNKAGQVGIRLLTPPDRNADQLARTMKMAQHASIYADFDQAQVDVAPTQGQGPGLDIFTGSVQQLRDIAPAYAAAIKQIGGLQILSRDGDERVALIYLNNTQTEEQFESQLAKMFPTTVPRGSQQGLEVARLRHSKGVAEGTKIRFSELGIQSEQFDGRLYRRSFQVNLPSDYFAADYDQAEIHLATAYSSGLDKNNKLIIRVNGVTATGFSLSKADGHVYKNKMLRLPLSAFKSGGNVVEIDAQLAKASDAKCEPTAQISGEKRFVISGKSTIRFPRLAHLAKLPDLAGTVTAGFPYVIGGVAKSTVIAVPNPGYPELSAAAGFATHIAVKAGVPLDFSLNYGEPSKDAKNAIIVGSFSQLPSRIATSITGIDQTSFQTSWMYTPGVNEPRNLASWGGGQNAIDRLTTASISASTKQNAQFAAQPVSIPQTGNSLQDIDPLDRWSDLGKGDQKRDPDDLGFTEQIGGLFGSVLGLKNDDAKKATVITNPNSDLLLSQRISPSNEKGVWTVLTARNPQALQTSVSLLAKPGVSGRVSGETVTINGVDRTVTSSITAQNYVQVRDFSLRNLHLVVAGWFSNNHLFYSLLLLLTLLGVGLASTRVLKTAGVDAESEERSS